MHVNSFLSALLLTTAVSAKVSTKSAVTCITKQGPKSTSPVKTTSKVLTVPWYAYKVSIYTPSTTVTPAASTEIVFSTTTILSTITLPVETDTVTSTESVTSTEVDTATTTSISTSTVSVSVTSTDTTTIAASAGFVPVETTVPGSLKRRAADSAAQNAKEDALEERNTKAMTKLGVKNGKLVCNPAVYPQSVKCVGVVAVVTTSVRTKTCSKTKTITAPTPVVTSTTTLTESSTITETPPHASTTTTVTTTISTTSTTTETDTSVTTVTATISVVAPQATYYAACSDNNIITSVNGYGITSAYVNNNVGQSFVGANSAYECCVACLNTANCGAAAYFSQGVCDLISANSGTCSQGTDVVFLQGGSGANFAFSNGYCGSVRPS